MKRVEILPGVTVEIDEDKYDVTQALKLLPQATGADFIVTLDVTLTDVIDKTESRVQCILGLRSK